MSEFDVSIVIPTYNRPQLITKALDSIETSNFDIKLSPV